MMLKQLFEAESGYLEFIKVVIEPQNGSSPVL